MRAALPWRPLIDFPTVAAGIAVHLGEASVQIPTKGAGVEGSLALAAVVDQPMAGATCSGGWFHGQRLRPGDP